LVAIFGAIILAQAPVGAAGGTLGHNFLGGVSLEAFATVFFAVAASLTVAFLSVILLEEKPLGEQRL
jgi:hypothetical protein